MKFKMTDPKFVAAAARARPGYENFSFFFYFLVLSFSEFEVASLTVLHITLLNTYESFKLL